MAFTAVIGLATGATAVTVATVAAAVVEIGVALSVVGAVTGSQTLMKVGAVMSLVGGVGGLLAGAAGSATAVAGETLSKAALDGTTSFGANSAAGAIDIGEAAMSSGVTAGEVAATDLAPLESTATASAPIATTTAAPVTDAAGTSVSNLTGAAADAANTPSISNFKPSLNNVTGAAEKAANLGPSGPAGAQAPTGPADVGSNLIRTGSASESSGSFFQKFGEFASKNKDLLNTGVKLVGGALQGASEGDRLDQQMEIVRNRQAFGNSVAGIAPKNGIINGALAQ